MMVYNDAVLVYLETAVVNLADTDTANKLIVVDGTDEHLGLCIRVSFRSRDIIYDGLKQRAHINFRIIQLFLCEAGAGRCKYKRAV